MHQTIQFKTTVPPVRNSVNRAPLRLTFFLILLLLVCFALSPTTRGKEKPDGDQGNGNTAEGSGALQSLTTGINNTAMGYQTLFSLTAADGNTAIGFNALFRNTSGFANTATGERALSIN